MRGRGTHVDEGWRITVAGQVTGRPFGGAYYASISPDGGAWPAPGTCTTDSASAYIDGPHRKEIDIVAVGDVCRTGSGTAALSFAGQFDAYSAIPKRYSDTQGQMQIRLDADGRVAVTLTST